MKIRTILIVFCLASLLIVMYNASLTSKTSAAPSFQQIPTPTLIPPGYSLDLNYKGVSYSYSSNVDTLTGHMKTSAGSSAGTRYAWSTMISPGTVSPPTYVQAKMQVTFRAIDKFDQFNKCKSVRAVICLSDANTNTACLQTRTESAVQYVSGTTYYIARHRTWTIDIPSKHRQTLTVYPLSFQDPGGTWWYPQRNMKWFKGNILPSDTNLDICASQFNVPAGGDDDDE
jgi:hypothetical protein